MPWSCCDDKEVVRQRARYDVVCCNEAHPRPEEQGREHHGHRASLRDAVSTLVWCTKSQFEAVGDGKVVLVASICNEYLMWYANGGSDAV